MDDVVVVCPAADCIEELPTIVGTTNNNSNPVAIITHFVFFELDIILRLERLVLLFMDCRIISENYT